VSNLSTSQKQKGQRAEYPDRSKQASVYKCLTLPPICLPNAEGAARLRRRPFIRPARPVSAA